MCVSNWLAHSMENLAEDADDDDDFFSRVLHNENHVLQQRNFIYRRLHKHRPIGTNFSTSQLSNI